jgi:hypothetical protein
MGIILFSNLSPENMAMISGAMRMVPIVNGTVSATIK